MSGGHWHWQWLLGLALVAGCGRTSRDESAPSAGDGGDGSQIGTVRSGPLRPVFVTADPVVPDIADLAVGKSGEIAIVGSHGGALSLDDTWSLPMPQSGAAPDAFVGTFSETGDPLWATSVGTTDFDAFVSVAFDDVVIAAGSSTTSLARFNALGSADWVQPLDFTYPIDVAVSPAGDSVVVGGSTSWVDESAVIEPDFEEGATYVGCFDAAGNARWERFFAGHAPTPYDVVVDSLGNALILGTFHEDIDLGEGLVQTPDGGIYLVKLAADGEIVFARTFMGGRQDYGVDLAITNDDGIVMVGYLQATVDFGELVATGTNATFVTKLDAGGEPLWTTTLESTEDVLPVGVEVDSQGNLLIAAQFTGRMETPLAAAAEQEGDSIVLKLDSAGDYLWERVIGGSGSQGVVAIDLNASDEVFVGGWFTGIIDIGGSQHGPTAPDGYGSFIARIEP